MLTSERLYKIKPLTKRNLDDLEDDKIWFPKAKKFNDPYDCAISPCVSRFLRIRELLSLLDELSNEAKIFKSIYNEQSFIDAKNEREKNQAAYDLVVGRLPEIGVLSLLDSPLNIVTWSHYGDQHKGFCVELSKISSDNIVDEFNIFMNGYREFQVSYTNIMPFVQWESFLKSPELAIPILLTTKYTHWAYECESRIINYDLDLGKAIKTSDFGRKISKVFIGCKAGPSQELERLRAICFDKDIPVIQLERKEYSFELTESEVSCSGSS